MSSDSTTAVRREGKGILAYITALEDYVGLSGLVKARHCFAHVFSGNSSASQGQPIVIV